jgi:hypothetical protein
MAWDLAQQTVSLKCDGPCAERTVAYSLLEHLLEAYFLSSSHAMFTEAMRQMHKLSDTVPPEDEQNFAIYCFAFTQVNGRHKLYKGAYLD